MQKTILLQSAGILDEEAKCTLKQNVYIKDGKIFKIVAENEDDHSVVADETIDCSKYFVSPGLANLHTHTAMNIFKAFSVSVTVIYLSICSYISNIEANEIIVSISVSPSV